jgi:hypothetical protein
MDDDWRLKNDLHEVGHAHMLTERMEAQELEHDLQTSFHDRVIVSRDGPEVFCYAGSEEQARKAEKLIQSLAVEHGWHVDSELQRWHPEAERWEDPEASIPSSRGGHQVEHAQLIESEREESRAEGFPEWELRVQCHSHHEARALAERLAQEGVPCLRRWHYLLLGALDEDAAKQLADRVREEAPVDATTIVEGSGKGMLDDVNRMGRNPFAVF